MLQAKVVDISSSSLLFSVSSLPFPLRSLEHNSLCPVQLAYYVRSTHFDVPHKSQTFLAKRGERRFFPPGFNVLKFEYKWPQRGVDIPLEKSFLLLGISKFAPVKLTPSSILFLLLYQNNHLLSFFVTSRCLRQTTRRLFPFSPEENHAYPQRGKGHLFIPWKYQQTTNFWKMFSVYFAPTSKFVTFREVSYPLTSLGASENISTCYFQRTATNKKAGESPSRKVGVKLTDFVKKVRIYEQKWIFVCCLWRTWLRKQQ